MQQRTKTKKERKKDNQAFFLGLLLSLCLQLKLVALFVCVKIGAKKNIVDVRR
jgi:hypothetical protein